jgi:hypothetical protein
MNCVMGTVTLSVDFNRANAFSLHKLVALLEVKCEHDAVTHHATFKVVTSVVYLLKQFCYLFEQYQIMHGKGLQKHRRTYGRRMAPTYLVNATGHLCAFIKGLQGKYKPITEMYDNIKALKYKHRP